MPLEEVIKYNHRGDEEALNVMMVMNCAPLLKGMKSSVIITIPTRLTDILIRELSLTPYKYIIFKRDSKKTLLMLYHAERLADYLSDPKVMSGLNKYGYSLNTCKSKEGILISALSRLTGRMRGYYDGLCGFPHETGYFLQYPIKDIEMFVLNDGKNFIMTGYWKVYDNPDKAKKTFKAYDKAREDLVRSVISGKKFYELVA
ncbi:MAG: DUF3793 family protein [Eubacterium sp.]|nr:DUF3793 family protein [Eubacterium sp.]